MSHGISDTVSVLALAIKCAIVFYVGNILLVQLQFVTLHYTVVFHSSMRYWYVLLRRMESPYL